MDSVQPVSADAAILPAPGGGSSMAVPVEVEPPDTSLETAVSAELDCAPVWASTGPVE